MNISSIVIQTTPQFLESVLEKIKANPEICEYHLHDEKGRIIVTIEGEDVTHTVRTIQSLPLSLDLSKYVNVPNVLEISGEVFMPKETLKKIKSIDVNEEIINTKCKIIEFI